MAAVTSAARICADHIHAIEQHAARRHLQAQAGHQDGQSLFILTVDVGGRGRPG